MNAPLPPIHTVATTRTAPADASVRHVSASGAAVAHVPMSLRVEIGCAGGLSCDELTVTARELRDDAPPALLASGLARRLWLKLSRRRAYSRFALAGRASRAGHDGCIT